MRFIGPLLAVLAVLAAVYLSGQAYLPYGWEAAVGIALGAGSIAAMSVALVLATRPKWVEPLFGGLDRMYGLHKWLGIAALALMLGHNAIEPELEHVVRETRLGEFASELGEVALNGFIGLILISWIKRIPFTRIELPWPLWRFTHRFLGPLFALTAFHQLAIDTPVRLDSPSSLYLDALCLAGLAAWLFTLLLAAWRRRPFVLNAMTRHGAVTELTLAPAGRSLRWKPGQFAFVSAPGTWLGEPHPFTIASAPTPDGQVRLAIKGLGRWTRQLPERLRLGQRMRVEGPYGRFTFRRQVRRQVWLAGGIGITPFLAWAEALTADDPPEIALIWAVTTRAEAYAADRLATLAARLPRLTVHIVASAESGRLTAAQLVEQVPFPLSKAELFYCGPASLLRAITRGLRSLGQSPRRVHSEAFELR